MINKDDILASDSNDCQIIIGDTVRRGKNLYEVVDLDWDVSGDGYYTETVSVHCKNLRTGKITIIEDIELTLES